MKLVISGTLIVGAIAYVLFSGITSSMVYYYSLSELEAKAADVAGKGVRVSGYVLPGSMRREPGTSQLSFVVFERETGRTLPVSYRGIIPDTLKDNAEVVVEGLYRPEEKAFRATTLLAKCPSKYEAQGKEHPQSVDIRKENK